MPLYLRAWENCGSGFGAAAVSTTSGLAGISLYVGAGNSEMGIVGRIKVRIKFVVVRRRGEEERWRSG